MVEKRHFMIDNKQCLYEHGFLYPIIARKVKYIPGNVYNHIKRKFITNWKYNILLGSYSNEDTPNFTNHEISEIDMRCNIFIR